MRAKIRRDQRLDGFTRLFNRFALVRDELADRRRLGFWRGGRDFGCFVCHFTFTSSFSIYRSAMAQYYRQWLLQVYTQRLSPGLHQGIVHPNVVLRWVSLWTRLLYRNRLLRISCTWQIDHLEPGIARLQINRLVILGPEGKHIGF